MIRIGSFSALQYYLSHQLESEKNQKNQNRQRVSGSRSANADTAQRRRLLSDIILTEECFEGAEEMLTLCGVVKLYGWPEGVFTETLWVDVDEANQRSHSSLFTFRIINVNKKFYRKINDIYSVAAPELVFLELASHLPLERLVEVGNMLCGTFVVRSFDSREKFSVVPLTTRAKIEGALREMGPQKNVKRARLALKYVCENAASPIESKLAVMFSLPICRGGFGVPVVLNKNMAISKNARGVDKTVHRRPDFYWPDQRVALDYDSKEWHDDRERAQADALRRNALTAAGIQALTLRNENIKTCFALEAVVKQLYKMLGMRKRKNLIEAKGKRMEIFASLFGPGGFDPFCL